MRETKKSRGIIRLPTLWTQEKEFSLPFSCVQRLIILDPVRQKFLVLVAVFQMYQNFFFFYVQLHYNRVVDKKKGEVHFMNEILLIKLNRTYSSMNFPFF